MHKTTPVISSASEINAMQLLGDKNRKPIGKKLWSHFYFKFIQLILTDLVLWNQGMHVYVVSFSLKPAFPV